MLGRLPFLQIVEMVVARFFYFRRKSVCFQRSFMNALTSHEKWMFQGDWGCATTSFLHRIRIHALLANFVPNSTQ